MTNQELADRIGVLAKARADNDGLSLRPALDDLTDEEITQVQGLVAALAEDVIQEDLKRRFD